MPPKAKFSKEEITQAAVGIVRANGMEGLTARRLGEALGSSARPVFTTFQNMEQVAQATLEAAERLYQDALLAEMAKGKYPPYKASGMGYIRFAKEEPELFRLLFMRDRSHEVIREEQESLQPILQLIQADLGIDQAAAYRFHLEMWIYVHGIATMFATGYLNLEEAFISDILTDAFIGLKLRWKQMGLGKEEDGHASRMDPLPDMRE